MGKTTSFFAFAAASLILCCCQQVKEVQTKSFKIGEEAAAGAVAYQVLDAEWKDSIEGSSAAVRVPTNRFLSIRLSIRNQSGKEVSLPFLSVTGKGGTSVMEVSEGQIPNWLGMLRGIAAGETVEGQILFDVAPGSYKLRITDGGEGEAEKTALVDLPDPMVGTDSPGLKPKSSTE